MTAGNFEWVFLLAGGIAGAAAMLLVLLALFRDRSRGRRRCPTCWYDMAGTTSLACPECGRTASSERRMFRTRRHWRRAACGLALLMIAAGVAVVPAYKRGWQHLVPSSLLVYIAEARERGILAPTGVTVVNGKLVLAPPTVQSSVTQTLVEEVWSRFESGSLSRWQARAYMGRCLHKAGVVPERYVQFPKAWPVGEALVGAISLPRFAGADRVRVQLTARGLVCTRKDAELPLAASPCRWWFDAPPPALASIECEIRLISRSGCVYAADTSIPIRVAGELGTFLDRLDSSETNERLRQRLNPRLGRDADGRIALIYGSPASAGEDAIEADIEFRTEIRIGDEVVGYGLGSAGWNGPKGGVAAPPLRWVADGEARVGRAIVDPAARGTIRIAVRAAPDRAGLNYLNRPFSVPRPVCWGGRFEISAVVDGPASAAAIGGRTSVATVELAERRGAAP